MSDRPPTAKERLQELLDHGPPDGSKLSNRDRTTALAALSRIEAAEKEKPPAPLQVCPKCGENISQDELPWGMLVVCPIPPHLRGEPSEPEPEEPSE